MVIKVKKTDRGIKYSAMYPSGTEIILYRHGGSYAYYLKQFCGCERTSAAYLRKNAPLGFAALKDAAGIRKYKGV